jgi:hypothetical protein
MYILQDLVTIDDFKERIVASLERYDVTIERLKKEMDEFTENATEIHREMATLQQRKLVIEPGATCALSVKKALTFFDSHIKSLKCYSSSSSSSSSSSCFVLVKWYALFKPNNNI